MYKLYLFKDMNYSWFVFNEKTGNQSCELVNCVTFAKNIFQLYTFMKRFSSLLIALITTTLAGFSQNAISICENLLRGRHYKLSTVVSVKLY